MISKVSSLSWLCLFCVAAAAENGSRNDVQKVSVNYLHPLVRANIAFVKKRLHWQEAQVKEAIKSGQEELDSLTSSSQNRLGSLLTDAHQKIRSLEADCHNQVTAELAAVKNNFIMDLLNCKRNQEMVTDIEKMVYAGKNLMDNFVDSAETLIKGFEGCITFNPFEMSWCLTKNMVNTARLMVLETVLTAQFTLAVAEDTADLVKTVYWCVQNAESTAFNSIDQILDRTHDCRTK